MKVRTGRLDGRLDAIHSRDSRRRPAGAAPLPGKAWDDSLAAFRGLPEWSEGERIILSGIEFRTDGADRGVIDRWLA